MIPWWIYWKTTAVYVSDKDFWEKDWGEEKQE